MTTQPTADPTLKRCPFADGSGAIVQHSGAGKKRLYWVTCLAERHRTYSVPTEQAARLDWQGRSA